MKICMLLFFHYLILKYSGLVCIACNFYEVLRRYSKKREQDKGLCVLRFVLFRTRDKT